MSTEPKPLSKYVLDQLWFLARGPMARQCVNPGAAALMVRRGLVREVTRPSPYAISLGKPLTFFEITDAGIEAHRSVGRINAR